MDLHTGRPAGYRGTHTGYSLLLRIARRPVTALVLAVFAIAFTFGTLPTVYAQVTGPELTTASATEHCLAKGRELARTVDQESTATTVTIDDVTVSSVRGSTDSYQAVVTLHQLARNTYGTLRGTRSVGCVVSRLDGEDDLHTTLLPLR